MIETTLPHLPSSLFSSERAWRMKCWPKAMSRSPYQSNVKPPTSARPFVVVDSNLRAYSNLKLDDKLLGYVNFNALNNMNQRDDVRKKGRRTWGNFRFPTGPKQLSDVRREPLGLTIQGNKNECKCRRTSKKTKRDETFEMK